MIKYKIVFEGGIELIITSDHFKIERLSDAIQEKSTVYSVAGLIIDCSKVLYVIRL